MGKKTKIYFISDAHLGINGTISSDKREVMLINWLDEIKKEAIEINLLGDIFDFWFEYKYLVPRGFIRFLAKLRELSDSGITINFFTGNHDMWTFDYLQNECKINILRKPIVRDINGKKFFIAHGDGIYQYDNIKYVFLKFIFNSFYFQFLFKLIHPQISFWIATTWSKISRKNQKKYENFECNEDYMVKFAKKVLEKQHIDFFVFGHRHIPFQIKLKEKSIFTNIGDWLNNFSYSVYELTTEKFLLTHIAAHHLKNKKK